MQMPKKGGRLCVLCGLCVASSVPSRFAPRFATRYLPSPVPERASNAIHNLQITRNHPPGARPLSVLSHAIRPRLKRVIAVPIPFPPAYLPLPPRSFTSPVPPLLARALASPSTRQTRIQRLTYPKEASKGDIQGEAPSSLL